MPTIVAIGPIAERAVREESGTQDRIRGLFPYLPIPEFATLELDNPGLETAVNWLDRLSRTAKVLVALSLALFFVVAVIVLPAAAWLVGDESFTATSSDGFCSDCHTMQPFVDSNHDSTHGGSNAYGIAAECTTCHLPHDSSWSYLTAKLRTGIHDIWVQTFSDTSQIDWKAKTEHREDFVYDSGCLTCHVELEAATAGQRQHDNYFAGVIDSKCVTCHAGVGHSNVNQYLLEHKYRP